MKELIKSNLEMTEDAIKEKKGDEKKKKFRERNASDKEWKTTKKKKGSPSKIWEIFYNVFCFLHIKALRRYAGM